MSLNAQQVEQLLKPVNRKRVQRDNKGMSHLAAYDVSAHLTRIFGFGGWEKRITSLELVSEREIKDPERDRMGWHVTYRCQMTLVVKDPAGSVIWSNDDGATGSASNLPILGDAHDFAMKNAISYALKRCAKDLGDQFGLSLYNKGSLHPLVVRTLAADGEPADVEKDLPEEMHPDTEPGAEDGGQGAGPGAAEALEGTVIPPQQPPAADDPVFGDWAAAIDAITSQQDAGKVLEELDRKNRGGLVTNGHAAAIRGAVKDKVAALGNGHKAQPARPSRPKGPPATERGAVAVPTGKGDDGEWVTGFLERLDGETDPDALGDFQRQVGAAVGAKTITPSKAVDLTAAIRNHRNKLQAVTA
jgi:hypothetical protein